MRANLIGIIDLKVGNIASVVNAVYHCGFDPVVISLNTILHNPNWSDELSHLILPGVGHFATTVTLLGFDQLRFVLQQWVADDKPLLGICLGMQLLFESSSETQLSFIKMENAPRDAVVPVDESISPSGLCILEGKIEQLTGSSSLPHIGWNEVHHLQDHPLLYKIKTDRDFYFVHSYGHLLCSADSVIGVTEYNTTFSSIVGSGSVVGVQFHPEKSQRNGLQLLDNFCDWDGKL